MLARNIYNSKTINKIPTRNGYGEGLVIAGEKNKNVVVLCADLTDSTRGANFRDKFPDRYIQVGVAEQNMASLASGLAATGKIPFISSYAVFSPGRNLEQIRTTICYNNVNVKIAGAHAGISVGPDGATHQAIEDIAFTRVIPNFTIVVPCDVNETRKATILAAEIKGPFYLRFARNSTPVFTTNKTPFKIGRAEIFNKGKDVTIIACGPLVYEALIAAKELKKEGIDVEVINNHTIKPIDKKTLLASVKKTRCAVTVEEHLIHGGLGSAVAEEFALYDPVPMEMIGVNDRFGETGEPDELIEYFKLTHPFIIKAVKKVLKRKKL